MSRFGVFIDFGSTFTKAVAFDLEREELAARVQTPSTVETDVNTGLDNALALLRQAVPVTQEECAGAVACSSAAGGLRLACVGLVPEFTTEAGRLAALGAGARISGTWSYELTAGEVGEMEAQRPDIVLLTGGTDGGNKKVILHNAAMLAQAGPGISTVLAAGNKSARDEIAALFQASGKQLVFTENVMPEFGRLELEPVNGEIRRLFLSRIMQAKGIARAGERIAGVRMPTPAAVLEAARLLSQGTQGEPGLGELLLVDVGGATTDVCSIGYGRPTHEGAAVTGLAEPFAKRTVEGDLGLFHNLDALAELARQDEENFGLPAQALDRLLVELHALRSVPDSGRQAEYQTALTALAVRTAVSRHAGRLTRIMTRNGEAWLQQGKDLTAFRAVIGGGGPVAFSRDPLRILQNALFDGAHPEVLRPKNPRFYLDARYILFAVGLLAQSEPDRALRIAKKYLRRLA